MALPINLRNYLIRLRAVQEGLMALGYSVLVNYVYHQKGIGIEEARITQKGKEKAECLNG